MNTRQKNTKKRNYPFEEIQINKFEEEAQDHLSQDIDDFILQLANLWIVSFPEDERGCSFSL